MFGVRHHGPGCARSLCTALVELAPDIVLVEGPPEGNALLTFTSDPALQPPLALLVYRPDLPRRAAFFPLAEFSPEWHALRYAAEHAIPARFCDLPQAITLAREPVVPSPPDEDEQPDASSGALAPVDSDPKQPGAEGEARAETLREIRDDPISALAEAAGFAEGELWWEEEIERRRDAGGMFEAILEAMAELRKMAGEETDEHERQREAWMRQSIRQAEREGFRAPFKT